MSPVRIIVSGMLSADLHQGGAAWAVLQYAIGLRELGHDVFVVEPIAEASWRPSGAVLERSIQAQAFRDIAARFDFEGRATLLSELSRQTAGARYASLREFAAHADVLLNVSGMLTDPVLLETIPSRVYLDLDPAFNQLWHAAEGLDMRFDGHTHFATVGQAIGRNDCAVPACDREWLPTVPPVVLSHWPAMPLPAANRGWTTVANWRAYGSITAGGVHYGQKAHSLRQMIDLPNRVDERFQLALSIHGDEARDLEALRTHRWQLVDPADAAGTPDRYRHFIQTSLAEIGIAKSGYVASRCGWFSDRSVCYLASGRPVVAQDTGFARYLPTGEGLLAFSTAEDAAASIASIRDDYPRHSRRAREIAADCFRSDLVLDRLLARVA
jgi:hypothetical protein